MTHIMNNSHTFPLEGWIPESDPDSGFAEWFSLDMAQATNGSGLFHGAEAPAGRPPRTNEHLQREISDQPLVVKWNEFESRVAEQKTVRDSLRDQGFCFWPWVIAKHFGIAWQDFNQGNRGSCAGCATHHAVEAVFLMHLADGYRFKYKRFNPWPTWELGKRDAGARTEGASMSMMLTCANKRGMFDVEKVGTYDQCLKNPPKYTEKMLQDAEKCQVAACYLGHLKGRELARVIFDCVAAGYPVAFGNSVAVSQQIKYVGNIKTAINRGSWMHATARIAYRKEIDGTEYVAHRGSWGKYWEVGRYENEPASVIWEDFETFAAQCGGRYSDAFAICMLEGEWLRDGRFDIAPIKIERTSTVTQAPESRSLNPEALPEV